MSGTVQKTEHFCGTVTIGLSRSYEFPEVVFLVLFFPDVSSSSVHLFCCFCFLRMRRAARLPFALGWMMSRQ